MKFHIIDENYNHVFNFISDQWTNLDLNTQNEENSKNIQTENSSI